MAVLNQLTVSGTTYDLNDKRISTTAVTTATHLLTCNSGVTSIAPITAANLASVLGEAGSFGYSTDKSNSSATTPLELHLCEIPSQGTFWVEMFLFRFNGGAGYKKVDLFIRNNFTQLSVNAVSAGGDFDFHLYYTKGQDNTVDVYCKSSESVSYKDLACFCKLQRNTKLELALSDADVSAMTEIPIGV